MEFFFSNILKFGFTDFVRTWVVLGWRYYVNARSLGTKVEEKHGEKFSNSCVVFGGINVRNKCLTNKYEVVLTVS